MAIEGDRGTPTERGKVRKEECQKSKKGESTIDEKKQRREKGIEGGGERESGKQDQSLQPAAETDEGRGEE
jgi:hypothetical protein